MRTLPSAIVALLPLALLCACPGEVAKGKPQIGPQAKPTDDARVVEFGGDLYAKDAKSNPEAESMSQPGATPGSGSPDETNGECRLYAPKLPDPKCCAFETGFDAEAAKRICGHAHYLGESIRMSCGYFFSDESMQSHPSFRASMIKGDSPKKAAEDEAEQLRFRLRKADIKAEPIAGLDGAYMIQNGKFRWAFLPGWSAVRKVSWIDESCPDDEVGELLKIIAAAQQPPDGAERPLIPTARSAG